MDIREYYTKLQELINAYSKELAKQAIIPAANELLAEVKNRIVRDGKNSEGEYTGSYSNKESWFGRDEFDKKGVFKPVGKANEFSTKTRKAINKGQEKTVLFDINTRKAKKVAITPQFRERQTMYLDGGYKELRNLQGKPIDKMNMFYTGSLIMSYQLQANDNEIFIGFISEQSAKIRKGQEKERGKIFSPTPEEIVEYKKNVIENHAEIARKILK